MLFVVDKASKIVSGENVDTLLKVKVQNRHISHLGHDENEKCVFANMKFELFLT